MPVGKLVVAGLILILSQMTFAQVNSGSSNLRDGLEPLELNYFYELTDHINRVQLENDTAYQVGKTAVSDKCVVFMNEKEFLGPTGISILRLIMENSKDYPFLLKGGDINKYCRKYPGMTTKQKGLVWVAMLTMMSHFESSCDGTAHAKGPNGTAQGLFQLHKGKEQNYTPVESGAAACLKNASLNAKQSSACTLAMLNEQLEKSGGKAFYDKSYWDVLRPHGRSQRAYQIAKAVSRTSFCNPTEL